MKICIEVSELEKDARIAVAECVSNEDALWAFAVDKEPAVRLVVAERFRATARVLETRTAM